MKETFKKLLVKCTSRKFIAMLLGTAVGIAVLCGADGELVRETAGAVSAVLSPIVYVFTEGMIDKKASGK